MRRRSLATTCLILAATLSLAMPAGVAGAAGAARLPVRVVAPAPDTELIPGSLVTLEWAVPEGTPRDLGAEIKEWEAFLSLDGGRTWPLRLTPHLDVDRQRFAFTVPNFPTRDARLLLRFGDEREETEVDVPGRFAIAAAAGRLVPDPLPRKMRLGRGESARRGERGVILWMEGARDGSGLRQVSALEGVGRWRAVHSAPALPLPLLWPASGREDLPPPESADLALPAVARIRPSAVATAPRPAPETRVLIHRYNE